jgi:cell division protease FtsH
MRLDPTPPIGPKRDSPRPAWPRWLPWVVFVGLLALLAMPGLRARPRRGPDIDYSRFYALVEDGKVDRVTLDGQTARGTFKAPVTLDGKAQKDFTTTLPPSPDPDLMHALRDRNVTLAVEPEHGALWGVLLLTLLPWALFLGGWVLLRRAADRALGMGGSFQSILQSKAHRFDRQDHVRVRFADVAGLSGAKRDLEEVVDFLRSPARFQRLGGKLPRGILLVGPPGTGKTLLARAVAGEAETPFFYVNGSEFIQLFVGVGASRVRALFAEAKASAPAIVFIDEIDAVGRSRGTGLGGGNDEREQTLNQLLSELDGFTQNDHTIVLAATNRPDVLDPALLRPGRFDRRVLVERPESAARLEILRVHTRGKPLAPDVSLQDIARATPGFSGADLANLCNEAALAAVRRGSDVVAGVDFATATDKVELGDPREALLDPDERRRVATHESGHALVARFTAGAEPLRRVSILPRGMSLGATQQMAASDRHLASEPDLVAKLRVLMGGYAAERVVYGNVSTGSEQDLRQATDLAYHMVAHFGMSERVGPVFHEQGLEHPFLGRHLATDKPLSSETSHVIEQEARRLLTGAVEAAQRIVAEQRESLERLVAELLGRETLDAPDLERLLAGPLAACARRPA